MKKPEYIYFLVDIKTVPKTFDLLDTYKKYTIDELSKLCFIFKQELSGVDIYSTLYDSFLLKRNETVDFLEDISDIYHDIINNYVIFKHNPNNGTFNLIDDEILQISLNDIQDIFLDEYFESFEINQNTPRIDVKHIKNNYLNVLIENLVKVFGKFSKAHLMVTNDLYCDVIKDNNGTLSFGKTKKIQNAFLKKFLNEVLTQHTHILVKVETDSKIADNILSETYGFCCDIDENYNYIMTNIKAKELQDMVKQLIIGGVKNTDIFKDLDGNVISDILE